MKSGFEMDALVGDRVMGWKCERTFREGYSTGKGFDPQGNHRDLPPWSTNEIAAREVWNRVQELGGDAIGIFIESAPTFQIKKVERFEKIEEIGHGATAQEICLAALKAVGQEIP